MSKNLFQTSRAMMLAVAMSVWATGWAAPACAQHDHAAHAGHQPAAAPGNNAGGAKAAPHGGQLAKINTLTLEAVYQPQEIRVYVYGPLLKPQSASDVKGEIVLKPRNGTEATRVPLSFVATPAGLHEQDYLTASLDLTRVKNGDMSVTFNLEGLPHQAKAAFTQTFALSKAKPRVTVAALTEADKAGVAQQKVCPVTGAKLGSMGAPIKVLVGDQPLYLCCKGCLGKVENAPETYLTKAGKSHGAH